MLLEGNVQSFARVPPDRAISKMLLKEANVPVNIFLYVKRFLAAWGKRGTPLHVTSLRSILCFPIVGIESMM